MKAKSLFKNRLHKTSKEIACREKENLPKTLKKMFEEIKGVRDKRRYKKIHKCLTDSKALIFAAYCKKDHLPSHPIQLERQ